MSTIIWDWNGTLLNDLDHCISTINVLLKKRKLPQLDRDRYKEVFSFPVKNYYQSVGFDFSKEDFEIPAKEFIELYNKDLNNCELQPYSIQVLKSFKEKGARQFILSAMQEDMLEKSLKQNGIFNFFEGIAGLNDHYAVSKIERGMKLIENFNIDKNNAFIIGDTIHDYEVASEIGIKSILIADGHQSVERLKQTKTLVLSDLKQLSLYSGINNF
jgi:phosphoglycolate phosphatase